MSMPEPVGKRFLPKSIDDLQASPQTEWAVWVSMINCICSVLFYLFLLIVFRNEAYLNSDEEQMQFFSGVLLAIRILLGFYGLSCYAKRNYQVAYSLFGGDGVLIAIFSSIALTMDTFEKDKEQSILLFFLISSIVLSLISIYLYITGTKNTIVISQNISQCYLDLNNANMCGVSFSDITKPGSGVYFELPYEDFRYAEIVSDGICNLLIHHKCGTYRLCLENPEKAKFSIEDIVK